MTNNRVPKKIVDKNGKHTTVYVSINKDGDLSMRRLDGLLANAMSKFKDNPTSDELTASTFDNRPWITADGDRVSTVPPGSENNPFYTFAPHDAFNVSSQEIYPDEEVYFYNPYSKEMQLGNWVEADYEGIDRAPNGSKIKIGNSSMSKAFTKSSDDEWTYISPVGDIQKVPSFWFKKKINEGFAVKLASAHNERTLVNEFEFDGVGIKHYFVNNDVVRVEAVLPGEQHGIAAHWKVDGNSEVLDGYKGTLADVSIRLAQYAIDGTEY